MSPESLIYVNMLFLIVLGKNMTDLENNQSCEADNVIIDSIAENSDDYGDDEVGGDNDSGGGNEERIIGNDLTIQDL